MQMHENELLSKVYSIHVNVYMKVNTKITTSAPIIT